MTTCERSCCFSFCCSSRCRCCCSSNCCCEGRASGHGYIHSKDFPFLDRVEPRLTKDVAAAEHRLTTYKVRERRLEFTNPSSVLSVKFHQPPSPPLSPEPPFISIHQQNQTYSRCRLQLSRPLSAQQRLSCQGKNWHFQPGRASLHLVPSRSLLS